MKGKLIYWFRVSEKRGWPQVIFDVHTYVGILTCSEIYQGRPLHIEISLLYLIVPRTIINMRSRTQQPITKAHLIINPDRKTS